MPLFKLSRSKGKVTCFRRTKLIIKDTLVAPAHGAPVGAVRSSSSVAAGTSVRDGGSGGSGACAGVVSVVLPLVCMLLLV